MNWLRLGARPAAFLPWSEAQRAWERMDAEVAGVAIATAKELLAARARRCPGCGAPPEALEWISIETDGPSWARGDGEIAWLLVCVPCGAQVDRVVDEELTAAARAGDR